MIFLYCLISFNAGILFVVLWRALFQGRLFGIICLISDICGSIANIGCQLWIDLTDLFRWIARRKVRLDEHENKIRG